MLRQGGLGVKSPLEFDMLENVYYLRKEDCSCFHGFLLVH